MGLFVAEPLMLAVGELVKPLGGALPDKRQGQGPHGIAVLEKTHRRLPWRV